MSTVEKSQAPEATVSRAGWLGRGLALGILGCLVLWAASSQLERAQLEQASTFQFQRGDILLAQLLLLLTGAVFTAVVLLAGDHSENRSWILVGAGLPPLAVLLVFWDWIGPGLMPQRLHAGMFWVGRNEVLTACVMAVGVMLTALVWPAVTSRARRGP